MNVCCNKCSYFIYFIWLLCRRLSASYITCTIQLLWTVEISVLPFQIVGLHTVCRWSVLDNASQKQRICHSRILCYNRYMMFLYSFIFTAYLKYTIFITFVSPVTACIGIASPSCLAVSVSVTLSPSADSTHVTWINCVLIMISYCTYSHHTKVVSHYNLWFLSGTNRPINWWDITKAVILYCSLQVRKTKITEQQKLCSHSWLNIWQA